MKKLLIGSAVSALVLTGMFVSAGAVSAYQGDPSVKGPNYSPERHQAMEKAFDTNNFSSWRELMGDRGRVTEKVNKTNFSKFSEAHRLAEAGNMTEAQKIRQSLGLNTAGAGSKMSRTSSRGQNRR